MMKGYLTVFLSLSLSLLTGFVLLLTGNAVRNGGKVRCECAVDTGMNAVLAEYNRGLFERYDLLYVDVSYLYKEPSISHLENRLRYYIEENTSGILTRENAPWGSLILKKVKVPYFETAAAGMGASMRNQAICYVEDTGVSGGEREVPGCMEEVRRLDEGKPMEAWRAIMDTLGGMELPRILNQDGQWEEVPLSNPADWVYGLVGSDVLYLGEVDLQSVNPANIMPEQYLSHREMENGDAAERIWKTEDALFLSYLFDKMGRFGNPREGSLLYDQLEYIAEGKTSDLENVRALAEWLFQLRFADNASCALADGDLRAQAAAAAEKLQAVSLDQSFKDPVTESILYACAFLESVGDMRAIYAGGKIPVRKAGHNMSVAHVLGGSFYSTQAASGWSYEQYLGAKILLAEEKTVNMRAMDIMEMDIRLHDGNQNFKMDWCIERYEATVTIKGSYGSNYDLRRIYGYF